jgi:hypothetical protein
MVCTEAIAITAQHTTEKRTNNMSSSTTGHRDSPQQIKGRENSEAPSYDPPLRKFAVNFGFNQDPIFRRKPKII